MISCKEYAELRKKELKDAPQHMELSIVQVGENPAALSYVRGKIKDCNEIGIKTYLYEVPEDATEEEFGKIVTKAALDGGGLMITMPLPPQLEIHKKWFLPYQDVDGLCYNLYPACTAEGIVDWLEYNNVNFQDKHVVIVGRGKLVGRPLAKILIDKGATVTVCNSHTSKQLMSALIENANIVVSATGHKDWFEGHFLNAKKKRLWIDVGINIDENGKICGDLDTQWLAACGQDVTPVPGGVGLLTRVALLKHLTTPYE